MATVKCGHAASWTSSVLTSTSGNLEFPGNALKVRSSGGEPPGEMLSRLQNCTHEGIELKGSCHVLQ